MVFKCCITHCNSDYYKIKIPFFCFPKNSSARMEWINATGIVPENRTSKIRVCSRHFSEDDYFTFSTTHKLKKGVIPHLHLHQERQPFTPADMNIIDGKREPNFSGATSCEATASDAACPEAVSCGTDDGRNIVERKKTTGSKKIGIKKRKYRVNTKAQSQFLISRFMHNDRMIFYYSGMQTYDILIIAFRFIFKSENGPAGAVHQRKQPRKPSKGIKHKLSPLNEFFLTLMKLRRGFDYQTLAHMFRVSKSTASGIFLRWINLMYQRLGSLNVWPHRDVIIRNAPVEFSTNYPNVLGSMSCTEFFMEAPSSMLRQPQCYSHCRGSNTLKALVMIDPNGAIIFVSSLFSGSISDKNIMEESKFNFVLEKKLQIGEILQGDVILADRGFNVTEILGEMGNTLNIPTFRMTGMQFVPNDMQYIRQIAKERIHVMRAIRRIKSFNILSKKIPVSLAGSMKQIFTVCALLTNFRYPRSRAE